MFNDDPTEPLLKRHTRQSDSNNNELNYSTTVCIYISSALACLTLGGVALVPWVFGDCSHQLSVVPDTIHGFVPRTIAFGSCLDNESPSELLDQINADVFVFLGDNIYADTTNSFIMRWLYNRLSCKPTFRRLVKRIKYILSVWDDHDYGQNDKGAEYPMKQMSRRMFLDFWRIPETSARRHNEGIYGSYTFTDNTISIIVIMLDLRFFRGSLTVCTRSEGWYCPSTNGTMLGETQWQWLKHTLNNTNADLVIIASSTQYAVDEYGYETWANFPHERARLAALLNPNKTIIISGDLHWGEISLTHDGLYDITSSGISQLEPHVLPNKYRIGAAIAEFNYGIIDLPTMAASVIGQSGVKATVNLSTVQSPFR